MSTPTATRTANPHPRLAVRRAGQGDPIVLIHGLGHHHGAWNRVFDNLARRYEVFAPDLAGFGRSPGHGWDTQLSVAQHVRDLIANFVDWGIERPHLAGNSMGGAVAMELAAAGHASSLTALSPGGFIGIPDRLQTIGMLGMVRLRSLLPRTALRRMSQSERGRRIAGSGIYANPAGLTSDEVLSDLFHLRQTKMFERTLARNALYRFDATIPVPTTIAWGVQDRILPFGAAARAIRRLPEAQFVALRNCGHVPMVDDPIAVNDAILSTVERAERITR